MQLFNFLDCSIIIRFDFASISKIDPLNESKQHLLIVLWAALSRTRFISINTSHYLLLLIDILWTNLELLFSF